MKKLAVMSVMLLLAAGVRALTTYNSVEVSINGGDPSWATFYFGHIPNGQPGSTALIIQCDYDRAELITNFDVYGEQMSSRFFGVTCTKNSPKSYTLNATPLTESLVMYGRDANGDLIKQNLNLTIHSATWTMIGYGSTAQDEGSAQISY